MSRWGTFAPWSRAPLLLWRQPVVALAVAAAAFLVALPAAAGPLFLAASGNATLQQLAGSACQWRVGAKIEGGLPFSRVPGSSAGPVGEELLEQRIDAVRSTTSGTPRLSEPVVTLLGEATVAPAVAPDQATVALTARDGFAGHVQILEGGSGRGIWLSDRFATLQRLDVGDRVTVTMGSRPLSLPVAAIYRDLRDLPDRQFWCTLRDTYRGAPLSERPVYPLALVARDDFVAAARGGQARNLLELSAELPGLTTVNAEPAVTGLQQLRARMADAGAYVANRADPLSEMTFESSLGDKVNRSGLVVSALTGTVVPLAAAGALAGLVIALAAGAFWVDRRRAELAVLSARGVGPSALGGKAALETAGAVALGAAAGWGAARYLVATVGPSTLVTPGAEFASATGAGTAFAGALAAIAVVAGVRAGRIHDTRPARRKRLRRWPWEVVPLAGAVLAWALLAEEVQVGSPGGLGTVAHIPPRLIVAPILLAIGLAMLFARLVRWGLSLARSWRTPMGRTVLYLAARRVIAAPLAAAVLVGSTALPVALSTYGATVAGSVARTLHAESQLVVGSDVVLTLTGPARAPRELAGRASVVSRYGDGRLADTTVQVLGVDPETFPEAAFWDDALPGPGLSELMSRLADPRQPAGVLTGMDSPAHATLLVGERRQRLELTTVAQLPGKPSGYPLLLVHRDVLARLAPDATEQLWVRGDPGEVAAAVTGLPVGTVSQARDVQASGIYAGITYTFEFLAAVSLLSGVIVVVGLLLYLDARSRARRSAYVVLRRMGVGSRAHWLSLLAEVGGLLCAGFAVGLGVAAAVIGLTFPGYDLNPGTAPATLLDVPWPFLGGLALVTAATAALAAAAAQRAVARARPSEVLRDTR